MKRQKWYVCLITVVSLLAIFWGIDDALAQSNKPHAWLTSALEKAGLYYMVSEDGKDISVLIGVEGDDSMDVLIRLTPGPSEMLPRSLLITAQSNRQVSSKQLGEALRFINELNREMLIGRYYIDPQSHIWLDHFIVFPGGENPVVEPQLLSFYIRMLYREIVATRAEMTFSTPVAKEKVIVALRGAKPSKTIEKAGVKGENRKMQEGLELRGKRRVCTPSGWWCTSGSLCCSGSCSGNTCD